MKNNRIIIFDTTLRDGEQCPGASMTLREKLEVMQVDECLERVPELAERNRHFEFFHFPHSDRVLVKTMNLAVCPLGPSAADVQEDGQMLVLDIVVEVEAFAEQPGDQRHTNADGETRRDIQESTAGALSLSWGSGLKPSEF